MAPRYYNRAVRFIKCLQSIFLSNNNMVSISGIPENVCNGGNEEENGMGMGGVVLLLSIQSMKMLANASTLLFARHRVVTMAKRREKEHIYNIHITHILKHKEYTYIYTIGAT